MRAREFIREQLAPLAKAAAPVVLPAIQQGIKRVLPAIGGLGAGLGLGKLASTDTATDNPPKKSFKLILQGKFGNKPGNMNSETVWHALPDVFPRDYPKADYGHEIRVPQDLIVDQIGQTGSAVIKSGIPSMDLAETYRQKLCSLNYPDSIIPTRTTGKIPLECCQIEQEPIKEGIRR
jgi:hypothetical protein